MTTIHTIGHGNRSIEEFVALLRGAGITCLLDVRAFPSSRRHSHFAREALERSLPAAGIRYVWEGKDLGGRRRPAANSPHAALRSPGFRAYADHMGTAAFRDGAERLVGLARASRAAVMCAERLPWQCHRFLISDYLVCAGQRVRHMIDEGAPREHRLHPLARLRDCKLVYDGETQGEFQL